MQDSKIEWTNHTFNPWIGCQKVSPGCDRCYAKTLMDDRYGRVHWGPHSERKRTSEGNWKLPLRWQKQAVTAGVRPKVFCASLADVWDNHVPNEWRADLFELIRQTPNLDWLLLTKRPENIAKMLPKALRGMPSWPWGNVWLGATAEDQVHYDRRWKALSKVPAAVRFISYEPALGPLNLVGDALPDWVICGGETGSGARLLKKRWARSLLAQCQEKSVAFFMKQMTNKAEIPADLLVREYPRKPPAWSSAFGEP